MKNRIQITILILVLIVSTIACQISAGGPTPPDVVNTTPQEPPKSFDEFVESSGSVDDTTGIVTITLSQEQLTAYIRDYLQKQPDTPISNPQVVLTDNKIEIYGTVEEGLFNANILITLATRIDETGNLDIEIESADFGPIPAPESVLNTISSLIDEALTGTIAPSTTGIKIESISIIEGSMTVSGSKR